jgi:hypothetical protein
MLISQSFAPTVSSSSAPMVTSSFVRPRLLWSHHHSYRTCATSDLARRHPPRPCRHPAAHTSPTLLSSLSHMHHPNIARCCLCILNITAVRPTSIPIAHTTLRSHMLSSAHPSLVGICPATGALLHNRWSYWCRPVTTLARFPQYLCQTTLKRVVRELQY